MQIHTARMNGSKDVKDEQKVFVSTQCSYFNYSIDNDDVLLCIALMKYWWNTDYYHIQLSSFLMSCFQCNGFTYPDNGCVHKGMRKTVRWKIMLWEIRFLVFYLSFLQWHVKMILQGIIGNPEYQIFWKISLSHFLVKVSRRF